MNKIITPGISDKEFIRDDVPMTKEEVREISICKLKLSKNSVLYDIGSGTGSIAIEAAKLANSIKVFAIEINPIAINLIKDNIKKFKTKNIQIIEGLAPDSIKKTTIPTHAFIGGTKGKLMNIINFLYKQNPYMRIVMNAISLESISEMTNAIKKFPIIDDEIIQVGISKANKIGNYNLMNANNPVFIFSFTFNGNKK